MKDTMRYIIDKNRIEGVCNDIKDKMGIRMNKVEHFSQGCYANVYLITANENIKMIIKLFNYSNVIDYEIASYNLLKNNLEIPMANIICYDLKKNYMCLEYLEGKQLSKVSTPNFILVDEVVKYLATCHFCRKNLSAKEATNIWIKEYNNRQACILERSRELVQNGMLSKQIYLEYEKTIPMLSHVIGDSVKDLSLLHGDYTPWNIIVNDDETSVVGVLDPYHSCFGDSELDLIMLKKSNGLELGLLERYETHMGLSPQFHSKSLYYNAWNELCHYYYSNRKESMNLQQCITELKQAIKKI